MLNVQLKIYQVQDILLAIRFRVFDFDGSELAKVCGDWPKLRDLK